VSETAFCHCKTAGIKFKLDGVKLITSNGVVLVVFCRRVKKLELVTVVAFTPDGSLILMFINAGLSKEVGLDIGFSTV
jgi:hypothetical protein